MNVAWLKRIPNWIKAAIAFITALATFITAFWEQPALFWFISITSTIGFILTMSIYLLLAQVEPATKIESDSIRGKLHTILSVNFNLSEFFSFP